MFNVVETFSGIGSQAEALKNIGIEYKIANTVEWDINAILAYCLIHNKKIDIKQYSNVSDMEICEKLASSSLSMDGKKPAPMKTINNLPIELKRYIYTAIKETRNLIDITKVHGKDLPNDIDLLTYSFPCQDLSACAFWHGNKSGISKSAHNRSGMLWEIERILYERKENKQNLPKFLIMENVVAITQKVHAADFQIWKDELNDLGYENKVYILNSENFGIPQHRRRCYMISVLCNGDLRKKEKTARYFQTHNLEDANYAHKMIRKCIKLDKILKIDYSNHDYEAEALQSQPNDTPSRRKIFLDNDLLFSYKTGIKDVVVNTVTTKQDRNPNSGLVEFDSKRAGKSKWRYLTPRECFLLMGFTERDYENLQNGCKNLKIRNKPLYGTEKLVKLAGNSIVVNVLEALFKQIVEINEFL